MSPAEPTLDDIADRIAIRELTARYNHAFDDVDPDAWAGTFTADGELVVHEGRTTRGHDALRALVERAGYGFVHITTDAVIDVAGDEARQVCTVLTAKRTREPKTATFSSTGRYRDELVRTSDGWRFRRRSVVMDTPVPT